MDSWSRSLGLWQFLYYYERFVGCPFRPAVTDPLIIIVPPLYMGPLGLHRPLTMAMSMFCLNATMLDRWLACLACYLNRGKEVEEE